RAGLDPRTHIHALVGIVYALGLSEASIGRASALDHAVKLDAHPQHQVNAWRIRALYYIRQGDMAQAEACRKQVELLQVQGRAAQMYEGTTLRREVEAYALVHDLLGVKQTLDSIAALARRLPGWVPWLHYARGEYARLRGERRTVLGEFERGLELSPPGRHPA